MATIKEQAAAIKGYAQEIDEAIVAKGGATSGGLVNAAAAIEALPTGGGFNDSTPNGGWCDDGKTHIWLHVTRPNYKFTLAIGGSPCTVDWGDKSSDTSYNAGGHIYEKPGEYRIDIVSGGLSSIRRFFKSSAYNGSRASLDDVRAAYAVEVDERFYFDDRCFVSFASLVMVKIHGVTAMRPYIFESASGIRTIAFDKCGEALPQSFINGAVALTNFDFSSFNSIKSGLSTTNIQRVSLNDELKDIPAEFLRNSTNLEEINWPSNLKTIGSGAFYACYCLGFGKTLTLPDTVTSIGNYPFNSTAYSGVIFPKGINTVPTEFMRGCVLLKTVEIHENVTSIGTYAFQNAPITKLYMKPKTPPTLPNTTNVINAIAKVAGSIIVPSGCLTAYQNAPNWTAYAPYMVESTEW